jgi:hypothetical protein
MASAADSNLSSILAQWNVIAGQRDISEWNTDLQDGRTANEHPTRLQFALLEPAVRRPFAPPGGPGRDKIPNHHADLAALPIVTGGRCWVRTNVG